MSMHAKSMNRRVLLIDDEQVLHKAYQKVLAVSQPEDHDLDDLEATMFGEESAHDRDVQFETDSAYQGEEGLELVRKAREEGRPYAMAFVDMRMPPGWDGLETISRIWECDPDLQVVICSAYSDYAWDKVTAKLGQSDQLLILKKPFDNIEVHQMACALTEKWNLMQASREKMGGLEEAVKERTADLICQKRELESTLKELQCTQAQLLQSDKLASIGQLAAGVAHEINNPIGFISSNLNSLGEYLTDIKRVMGAYEPLLDAIGQAQSSLSAQAGSVRKIREEVDIEYVLSDLSDLVKESIEGAQRVRKIVADLRDFSHVDSDDATIENINTLLDKTISVASNELKYKADIKREYGQIPDVLCYGGKLGQVFLNLLVNAAQAIEQRGTIIVRSGLEDDRVYVEIEDTGCGIPQENLNRIFEPFFTTKEVGKGTGLGLNLAYNIVQDHDGQITACSTVGQGTTFRVELPVAGPPDGNQDHASENHQSVA